MARNRKRPRTQPPTPRVDLSDWQGFRARRQSPRMTMLVIAAVAAVVSTILMAQFKEHFREIFEVWIFTLLALQVLVVAESDRHLRGWTRRAAPVASAFATAGFVATALGTGTTVAFVLCASMLVIGFMPPSWHDRLLQAL